MGKRLDLTGQRFGKLTVLHPAENIGGQTAWVCRCGCGQEAVVRTGNLRSGRTRSCGCQRRAVFKKTVTERKNNTSGVSGVEWLSQKRQWKATICVNRKRYYLGAYRSFEDAVNARKRAEKARLRIEKNLHDRFLQEFALTQAQSGDVNARKQNAG